MAYNRGYAFLIASVFVWLLALVLLLQTFLHTPHLGGVFSADTKDGSIILRHVDANGPIEKAGMPMDARLVALETEDGMRVPLTGREAILGRHETPSFASYNATLEDKKVFWAILNSDSFSFVDQEGRAYRVTPQTDPKITQIDFETILKMMLALIVIMVTVGIWVFATPTYAVTMLGISGLGLSVNMICGAFLAVSEITIAPWIFHTVISLASWGGATFAYALLTVIWHFPRRITRVPVAEILIAIGIALQLNIMFQIGELPLNSFEIAHLLPAPVAIVASTIQWFNTRGRPVERASVIWFSMTIYGLVTIVFVLYSIPVAFDTPPILGPAMANVFLALIFFGIALGTVRYRLFDVHWIWLRVLVWVFAGFLVVVVDLALAYALNLNQLQILPLALLVAGWVYFPVRNKLMEWFFGDTIIKVSDHIPELLKRFNSVRNLDEIDGRFVNFLQRTFDASEVASIDPIHLEQSRVENHGLFLRVPTVTEGRSVKLVGKAKGRQLFSGAEKTVADSFLQLVRSIHDGNLRETRRLSEERRRITRDLHDDVGGKILSMIYQAPDKKTASQAQDALQALKETIVVLEDAQETKFSIAWEGLREEVCKSQPDASFVEDHENSHRVLSAREFVNLKRIMQEIASNALKYAVVGTFKISTEVSSVEEIVLRFQNDAKDQPDTSLSGMRGLTNIQSRTDEMGGRLEVRQPSENDGQFCLTLTLPSEPVT